MIRKATKTAKMMQKENDVKEKHKKASDINNNSELAKETDDQDIKSELEIEEKAKSEDKSELTKKELGFIVEEAENKSREWQDKYLRLSAEFDNYRKRTLKEKADLLRYANEDLLMKILSVVDDFERSLQIIDKSEDVFALKEGIHLIYNKFNEFTKQNGIKEIEALGQVFNIDFHEAMTKIPAPSEELKGKVVDVIEKGYMLGDKVIRYAKVVVGE
jgi:molecular chaperone GrpE